MLTVVIVAFKSKHLLEKRIQEIGIHVPIIIVDNSLDNNNKILLESKYSNVNVIIPEKNFGFGRASNIGLDRVKTQFAFLTQPDLLLEDDCINKLIECIKKFKDFTILTPLDKSNKDFVNYEIYNKYDDQLSNNIFNLAEVDYVDLSWLINLKNFDYNDRWDENIFLYFEAPDFCKRIKKKSKRIFIAKNINTSHLGSKSHEEKYNFEALLTRNWHYNWSKFYYLKKHNNYFYALKKTISSLIKNLKKYLAAFFKKNGKDEKKLILAEIKGLISSYLNTASYYRPYEKYKDKDI